jgi:hypothetical protein
MAQDQPHSLSDLMLNVTSRQRVVRAFRRPIDADPRGIHGHTRPPRHTVEEAWDPDDVNAATNAATNVAAEVPQQHAYGSMDQNSGQPHAQYPHGQVQSSYGHAVHPNYSNGYNYHGNYSITHAQTMPTTPYPFQAYNSTSPHSGPYSPPPQSDYMLHGYPQQYGPPPQQPGPSQSYSHTDYATSPQSTQSSVALESPPAPDNTQPPVELMAEWLSLVVVVTLEDGTAVTGTLVSLTDDRVILNTGISPSQNIIEAFSEPVSGRRWI